MRANLSILGLYNYDNTIMDGLIEALPKDPQTEEDLIDSSLLVNNILLECAELEVCYPEPETMKTAIGLWAQIRTTSWYRIFTALDAEYNPIHNYDRYEDIDKTVTPGASYTTTTTDITYTDTITDHGYTDTTLDQTYTDTITDPIYTTTTTVENPGYNSNTLVTAQKTSESKVLNANGSRTHTPSANGSFTHTPTSNGSYTHTPSTTGSQTVSPDGESDSEIYSNHLYGNIGVTTAAQMIDGELKIRRNDIYNIITNEFRRRFCLLVY